jgi:hypothetical protein
VCGHIQIMAFCPEAVPVDLKDEVMVIEGQTPLQERHWLELEEHELSPE